MHTYKRIKTMKLASNVHEVIKLFKEFNATERVIPFGR